MPKAKPTWLSHTRPATTPNACCQRSAVPSSTPRAGRGSEADETPVGATIFGGRVRGGAIDSRGDHRIAMSFAVAGLIADGAVTFGDCANVATSFPGFDGLAASCGFSLKTT